MKINAFQTNNSYETWNYQRIFEKIGKILQTEIRENNKKKLSEAYIPQKEHTDLNVLIF